MTDQTVTFEHTVKVDVADMDAVKALETAVDGELKRAMAEVRMSVGTMLGAPDIALVTGIKGTSRMIGYVVAQFGIRVSVPVGQQTVGSDLGHVNTLAAAGAQGLINLVIETAMALGVSR